MCFSVMFVTGAYNYCLLGDENDPRVEWGKGGEEKEKKRRKKKNRQWNWKKKGGEKKEAEREGGDIGERKGNCENRKKM